MRPRRLPQPPEAVSVLDVAVEVAAFAAGPHECGMHGCRDRGVPIDAACAELDFQRSGVAVVADGPEV